MSVLKKNIFILLIIFSLFIVYSCTPSFPYNGTYQNAYSLDNNVYYEDNIYAGETKWYYFYAQADTLYTINWDDLYDGSGSYTCDIIVSVYDSNMNILYSDVDSGYYSGIPISVSESQKIYILVEGYNYGSYAIRYKSNNAYSLEDNVYYEDSISAGGTKWYYFYAQADTLYTINWDDLYDGSGSYTCDIEVSVYDSNRNILYSNVNSGYYSGIPISVSESQKIYISVKGYSSDDSGTYAIRYKSNNTYHLEDNVYYEDNISAGETKWYYFYAQAGSSYTINWDDSYEGSGSYTCDIKVSVYDSNMNILWHDVGSGYYSGITISVSESQKIYILVKGYLSYESGTYAIRYKSN